MHEHKRYPSNLVTWNRGAKYMLKMNAEIIVWDRGIVLVLKEVRHDATYRCCHAIHRTHQERYNTAPVAITGTNIFRENNRNSLRRIEIKNLM